MGMLQIMTDIFDVGFSEYCNLFMVRSIQFIALQVKSSVQEVGFFLYFFGQSC